MINERIAQKIKKNVYIGKTAQAIMQVWIVRQLLTSANSSKDLTSKINLDVFHVFYVFYLIPIVQKVQPLTCIKYGVKQRLLKSVSNIMLSSA